MRRAPLIALICWVLAAALSVLVPAQRPAQMVLDLPVALALTARPTMASTMVWSTVTLHTIAGTNDTAALRKGLSAIERLTPERAAPPAYGARMLLRAGDLPGSLEVLGRAHERFPTDPFFPWLLGMQLWQDADRPVEAADWLDVAAELDPSNPAHRAAANALRAP